MYFAMYSAELDYRKDCIEYVALDLDNTLDIRTWVMRK